MMSCRHGRRQVPLLSIMSRLGWARDPVSWTAGCWDGDGHRSTVAVRLGHGFVTLEGPALGLVYLSPLQVGQLRGALKSAGLDLDLFGGSGLPARPPPASHVDVTVPTQARRTMRMSTSDRPTVADIAARLSAREIEQGRTNSHQPG
jgi:hypothetical protein